MAGGLGDEVRGRMTEGQAQAALYMGKKKKGAAALKREKRKRRNALVETSYVAPRTRSSLKAPYATIIDFTASDQEQMDAELELWMKELQIGSGDEMEEGEIAELPRPPVVKQLTEEEKYHWRLRELSRGQKAREALYKAAGVATKAMQVLESAKAEVQAYDERTLLRGMSNLSFVEHDEGSFFRDPRFIETRLPKLQSDTYRPNRSAARSRTGRNFLGNSTTIRDSIKGASKRDNKEAARAIKDRLVKR